MKNQVKNLLRAGVFVLAAVFAFAFTEPLDPNQTYYAWDNGPVTVIMGTTQFNCDENVTEHCLYKDPERTDPVTIEQEGKFQLISP
ncbi:hypothetical protein [Aquiflexum sp.]|uniref:hypothetical protein n=1 Tax=Aquiflexum sp. TaxID=1872584 RepID=UPI0035932D06